MPDNLPHDAKAPKARLLASKNPKNEGQSVAKAFAALQAFGRDRAKPAGAEVAARAGLDRGTDFQLIQTLLGLGSLRETPEGHRFWLTLHCLQLGYSIRAAEDLQGHATPQLREFVPCLDDAGALGLLNRCEVAHVAQVDAELTRHGVVRRPGSRVCAYAAAMGQPIIAWLPPAEQVAQCSQLPRVKLSEWRLTDLDALPARLEAVRACGYALSDGEDAYGHATAAAPVLDGRGLHGAGR